MADILKVTTPLVQKQNVQPNKQSTDPTVPFNLQEIPKVIKTGNQGEILKQNNGMIDKEEAPAILMDLLKDPSVTVNFLKNIFMLQEIIKLLPVNNQTVTQEIEQLFNALLIQPEDIVPEMMRQENTSTVFKGELFNFLRDLLSHYPQPEMRGAVANLLKSINSMLGNRDVLDAVANGLQFLSESMDSSKSLSVQLRELSHQFREGDAGVRFNSLKLDVLGILGDVENSILYSPKIAKVVSIMTYNLSRFNNNPDFFQESISQLLMLLDGKQRKADFLTHLREFTDTMNDPQRLGESSKIMDVLAKIIGRQSSEESINLLNADKIEKIIHSLLSSPCNFTPLLHFVVPVQFMDMKSFAEIWINPNGGEDERGPEAGGEGRKIHLLVVFDVEGIGQFEAELFVNGKNIDFTLLCPPAYVDQFSDIPAKVQKSIAGLPYQISNTRVDKLARSRSLMEVFKSLPYKRTGVDVKI